MIELITVTSGEGTSGFVSALSASPDLAMKLAPGLLKHDSPSWRAQAVMLLHSLGTDEALDMLIDVLETGGEPERRTAAILVANSISTHGAELKARVDLLRERKADIARWPFEGFFPGRIAIAILEALKLPSFPLDPALQNRCIIEASQREQRKALSKRDRRLWERVNVYIKLNAYRRRQ